jgi:hypothetical protein
MDEHLPIIVTPDVQRIAHQGGAANCQTDRNADGSWPAVCPCSGITIELEEE